MVFRKQLNGVGDYKDKDGKRWDILSCKRTESLEFVQTGTTTKEIDGEIVEVPVMEQRVVINKGWDSFSSLEEAIEEYGVAFDPLPERV